MDVFLSRLNHAFQTEGKYRRGGGNAVKLLFVC